MYVAFLEWQYIEVCWGSCRDAMGHGACSDTDHADAEVVRVQAGGCKIDSPGLRAGLRSLSISLCLGMRHARKWLAGVGCLLMGWLMPVGVARHCFAQHMSSGQMGSSGIARLNRHCWNVTQVRSYGLPEARQVATENIS